MAKETINENDGDEHEKKKYKRSADIQVCSLSEWENNLIIENMFCQ